MVGSRFILLLLLSSCTAAFFISPALAVAPDDCSEPQIVVWNGVEMKDSDCDGVPDEIEDAVPNFFGVDHSTLGEIATFQVNNQFFTLFVARPGSVFRNVTLSDTANGIPPIPQEVDAAPYGWFKFDVVGFNVPDADDEDSVAVTLILHDYRVEDQGAIQLVSYSSPSCPTDPETAEYDYPVTVTRPFAVGPALDFSIIDVEAVEESCDITDTIPFTVAPVKNDKLDIDDDQVFVFEDNCPDTTNTDQTDMDNNGIGDACEEQIVAQASVYSHLGFRHRRFKRDIDIWEFEAPAGDNVTVTVKADPVEHGSGKKLNLILFGKTRGARLLRIDRGTLDPHNSVEATIPKKGKYWIVVGQPFTRWRGKPFRGIYQLILEGKPETVESLQAAAWVGRWWHKKTTVAAQK